MTDSYACILAAGKGTRNDYCKDLHKGLLPIMNKPVISYLIDAFKNSKIIIAVGYKKEQLISYIKTVHSNRDITFVDVENFEGEGSGPGYSLLCCKLHLQHPFICVPVDNFIIDKINTKVVDDWVGASLIESNKNFNFCLIDGDNIVSKFYYGEGTKVFNGIMGIYDYKSFWRLLEISTLTNNEKQTYKGLEHPRIIKFDHFYDTGTTENYKNTIEKYSGQLVFEKHKEFIFIDNHTVTKFISDKHVLANKIERTKYLPKNTTPKVLQINDNMYCYKYINGTLLSEVNDVDIFKKFLEFYKRNFLNVRFSITTEFQNDCKKMYYDKTVNRVKSIQNFELETIDTINGKATLKLDDIIQRINWDKIVDTAIPTLFHGDLQPENILWNGKGFKLIDWRESFNNNIQIGDAYYDLGKLLHGLLINGQLMLKKQYEVTVRDKKCEINFLRKNNLDNFMFEFKNFCEQNNLNYEHVVILAGLQYLSICSIYTEKDYDYFKFLYLLSKYLLTDSLNLTQKIKLC
jgi:GTP:adenosylcobinamide-phosphate guanylyltransferase/thiamine kinase-like enzyme